MIMKLWTRKSQQNRSKAEMARKTANTKLPPAIRAKPRLKSINLDFDRQIAISPNETGRARLELYRYLRDNIPVLNAVIWTWVRLCSAKFDFQISGANSTAEEQSVRQILQSLDQRIYRNGLLKRGGFRELLLQFFESLFTDGAVCGELQLAPSGRGVDRFLLADMRRIVIEPSGEDYRLLQEFDDRRTVLNPEATF